MVQQIELTTYEDLIIQMIDYMGAEGSAAARRDSRRAIRAAMRRLPNDHAWSYYTSTGRVNTVAPVPGSITYDHTGGAQERLVTFSTAVVPESWATQGVLEIADIPYEVAEWISVTELTLSVHSNPGEDLDAGTSAILYRDTYPMPHDFISADQLYNRDNQLQYVHPRDWLALKTFGSGSARPAIYTFTGDPNYQGTMAVRFFPYPDSKLSLDYLYQRRGRTMQIETVSAGSVSVTNNSANVTGVNTTFTDDMVGSIIRISSSSSDLPTGRSGINPFNSERTVMTVSTPTLLITDQLYTATSAGDKYEISDPLDVEDGTMLDAFLRLCELELTTIRRMEGRTSVMKSYLEAVIMAKETDSRSTATKGVSSFVHGRRHPVGADVE